MTPEEVIALAEGFIAECSQPYVWDKDNVLRQRERSESDWATSRVFDITYQNPAGLWDFILEVLRRTKDMDVLAILAAGPLEDYLSKCGESVIERVEAQAQSDERFKHLLGGVWRNAMSDDLWRRICECRGEVW